MSNKYQNGYGHGEATGLGDEYGRGYGKSHEYEDEDGAYSSSQCPGIGRGTTDGRGYDGDYVREVLERFTTLWGGSSAVRDVVSRFGWDLD